MLLAIDEGSRQPIYLQIVRQIKEQILVGELQVGDELPSVRDLGDSLGISLHTARSAYQVLAEEGLLRVRMGKNARIAAIPSAASVDAIGDDYRLRTREWMVDGLLQGLSADAMRRLLEDELEELTDRGARTGEGKGRT